MTAVGTFRVASMSTLSARISSVSDATAPTGSATSGTDRFSSLSQYLATTV